MISFEDGCGLISRVRLWFYCESRGGGVCAGKGAKYTLQQPFRR